MLRETERGEVREREVKDDFTHVIKFKNSFSNDFSCMKSIRTIGYIRTWEILWSLQIETRDEEDNDERRGIEQYRSSYWF